MVSCTTHIKLDVARLGTCTSPAVYSVLATAQLHVNTGIVKNLNKKDTIRGKPRLLRWRGRVIGPFSDGILLPGAKILWVWPTMRLL